VKKKKGVDRKEENTNFKRTHKKKGKREKRALSVLEFLLQKQCQLGALKANEGGKESPGGKSTEFGTGRTEDARGWRKD